ncbi:MAG: hypothetical protein ACREMI_05470 [Gemmatimonadales bacterium]
MLLACGKNDDTEPPLLLHATVAFPPKDTILLDLPAESRQCSDRRSLLVESLSPEGSGVLLRLRYGDSLTSDSFPIVIPGDTATVPAAVVAIRFFVRDVPRGYVLDSGTVAVRREGNTITARTDGVGVESGIRIPARLEYRDVPIGTDTVSCSYQP